MKVSGSLTKEVVGATSYSQLAILTMERMKMERRMVKVSISGKTAKSMMVNGSWESNMGMACGKALMENHTSASGKLEKPKAMAYMFSLTVINTKASGFSAYAMETVQISSPTVTATLVSTKKESLKALVNTSGRMAAVIQVSSIMDSSTVTVNGRKSKRTSTVTRSAICMKACMRTIRSTDMVSLSGSQAIATKETIMMMSAMATE